LLSFICFYLLR